jgi:hypothetical protein
LEDISRVLEHLDLPWGDLISAQIKLLLDVGYCHFALNSG